MRDDPLDSRDFYELAQAYRHASDQELAGAAFDALKDFVRKALSAPEPVLSVDRASQKLTAVVGRLDLSLLDTSCAPDCGRGWIDDVRAALDAARQLAVMCEDARAAWRAPVASRREPVRLAADGSPELVERRCESCGEPCGRVVQANPGVYLVPFLCSACRQKT